MHVKENTHYHWLPPLNYYRNHSLCDNSITCPDWALPQPLPQKLRLLYLAFYCLHSLQKKKFPSLSSILYYSQLSSFYMDLAILHTVAYPIHFVTAMPYGPPYSITSTGTKCVLNMYVVQGAGYPVWFNRNWCGKILHWENINFDI